MPGVVGMVEDHRKRRIVQHGPNTLTVSLPSDWTKRHALRKGDELDLISTERGLLLTTDKGPHFSQSRVRVAGLGPLIPRVISALYKRGYDEIVVEYERPEELEQIHDILAKSCIGFEIIDETEGEVRIRSVSEPSNEEFRTLFRRIFYFLLSIAQEGAQAAAMHDNDAYHKLVLRDQNVNKLADFCRRLVHRRRQREYASEPALYHIIEQLEKIGDRYGAINVHLRGSRKTPGERILQRYARVNVLLRGYERVFFDFTLASTGALLQECSDFLCEAEHDRVPLNEDPFVLFQLESIAVEIHNLIGPTLALHL